MFRRDQIQPTPVYLRGLARDIIKHLKSVGYQEGWWRGERALIPRMN